MSHRFPLELERVRLRAMLAIERASREPDDELLARVGGELVQLERVLAEPHDDDPARLLAWRLGLDDDDVALLWTVVAASIDPLLLPHLAALGSRGGATISVHARIWELSGEGARALMLKLIGAHPLLRDHVLGWQGDAPIPMRPLIAAPRTITWLAGEHELDEALAGAACVLAPDDAPVDDRLYDALCATPSPLIVVDRIEPLATAARKVGREVIALDLRYLAPDGLDQAVLALRRECRLRDAVPLIMHLDQLADDPWASRIVASAIATMPGPFAVTSQRDLALAVPRPTIHASEVRSTRR